MLPSVKISGLRIFSWLALASTALFLSSCQTAPTSIVTWSITGTVWNLVELNGEMVAAEKVPTLQLEPGGARVVGFGGVNRFTGGYTLEGDKLSLGLTASTRMAGPPKLMDIESKVFQILGSVTGYEIKGQWLALKSGDKVVVRAQAMPAQPFPPK